MKIIGGMIAFEDGIKKTEEYAPARKAHVELKFEVEEGADADAAIDYVSKVAMAKTYDMLAATEAKAPDKLARGRPRKEPEGARTQVEHAATVERPKTDKDKLAEAAGIAEAPKELEKPTADAASIVDEGDDLGDMLAPQEPVSDVELNDALQKKNAVLKNGALLRSVIKEFVPEGKSVNATNIPQEKRHEFLAKIKALEAPK